MSEQHGHGDGVSQLSTPRAMCPRGHSAAPTRDGWDCGVPECDVDRVIDTIEAEVLWTRGD